MVRWAALNVGIMALILTLAGCSGGGNNPVGASVIPGQTPQTSAGDHNNWLLGYYDIYFDIESGSFEAVENRSASFTLNIVPFLNKMTLPKNGITFDSIVIHNDDPAVLGVDVVFSIYHPFPGYDQYNAYDMRGVVIGDGSQTMEYNGLRCPLHGTDLLMKNSDGYTRWFNPSEFTTELIFGYAPGGWQNFKGDANLNPYKYYSKHLESDGNLWSYLTTDNNWDGIFENGSGRIMELEFPMPPGGNGLKFGYAVVVSWEDQGPTGPFHPYHAKEPIAASVDVTPDIWYNPTDGSGGNLILDIDLFSWEEQPSTVKIESSVLDGIYSFDFDTYAGAGGENYSTWHVEAPAKELTTGDGHYFWVIAECDGYDYKNGLPDIPSADGPLAAFFRYDLAVSDESPNPDPLVCDVVVDTTNTPGVPYEGWAANFTFDASGSYDPNGIGIISYEWDFNNDGTFGDAYDAGDDIQPVKFFDSDYYDKVSVRISNGEIDSECSVDVDITVYPSKNLPLKAGDIPNDIATDPVDGDLLVLYNSGEIWKHEVADFYQPDDAYMWADLNTLMQNPRGLEYIDVAGNSAAIITGIDDIYGFNRFACFLGDGTPWSTGGVFIGSSSTIFDAFAYGDNCEDVSNIGGWFHGRTWSGMSYQEIYWYSPPDYTGALHGNSYWFNESGSKTGPNQIYRLFLVACETAKDSSNIWFLEDDADYYASKWEAYYPSSTYGDLTYANAYFGTGYQTESDDGWYDAKDISRDVNDRYYVLDQLSDGSGRVKAFSTGNPGSPIGAFDVPSEYSSAPLRIEGTDYDHPGFGTYMFVLHGNATDGYFLSIFLENELPD